MKIKPDLLKFNDGSTVTVPTWPKRRNELYQAIVPHEYGGFPPKGIETAGIRRSHIKLRDWKGVVYSTYEVQTTFEDGRVLSLTLSLWIPPGDGPFPVVLNGDGCWRFFNDEVIHKVVGRGNIAASFDRTEAAADHKDLYRETGLYRLFPKATFGVISAWAWAYHRCMDVLGTLPLVQPNGIAITGHSRGGKTVLLAGATDERIALINPNDSGTGGSALNHLKSQGAEYVDSFFKSGNIFWFGQHFADHRYRDEELPYDQHFLHALVAPRPLLVTEAFEDKAANPPGSYAACLGARGVYHFLGVPENIGWAIRDGGHNHSPMDFEALLDYMDLHLHGRMVHRNFQFAFRLKGDAMGLLSFLGFGKKKPPNDESSAVETVPSEAIEQSKEPEIVVYSSSDATRCINARELLEKNGYEFQDKRVDDDMSTRAWLQRATGDDGLPKVFINVKCYGGYEDIHAMISDGTFQQALEGTLDDSGDQKIEQLKEIMSVEAIAELLKQGEVLTIDEGGAETEVWAEPFANPPVVYYEGAPEPLEEIEHIASQIVDRIASEEIEVSWKEED